jgi:hypothetical protein
VLELSAEEAELVAAEAEAATGVWDGPLRQQAADLADRAGQGAVPDDLVPVLERILSASLQGGRARRRYRAEGEGILNRVLMRTPSGRNVQDGVRAVNQALSALDGRPLDHVGVAVRTPGHYRVSLRTAGVGLVLALGPDGVSVESLEA